MVTETQPTLRIHEVAERVGVSVATIYRQMKKGRFAPQIRGIGKSLRWDSEALEQWIRNGGK